MMDLKVIKSQTVTLYNLNQSQSEPAAVKENNQFSAKEPKENKESVECPVSGIQNNNNQTHELKRESAAESEEPEKRVQSVPGETVSDPAEEECEETEEVTQRDAAPLVGPKSKPLSKDFSDIVLLAGLPFKGFNQPSIFYICTFQ